MKPKQYETIRHELGWTDREIAELLGRPQNALYRFKRGELAGGLRRGELSLLRALGFVKLTASKSYFERFLKEVMKT